MDTGFGYTMPRAGLSKALQQIAERGLIARGQVKSARIPEATRLQFESCCGGRRGERRHWPRRGQNCPYHHGAKCFQNGAEAICQKWLEKLWRKRGPHLQGVAASSQS